MVNFLPRAYKVIVFRINLMKTKFLTSWFLLFLFVVNVSTVQANIPHKDQLQSQAEQFQKGLQQAQNNQLDQALKTWKSLSESGELIPELKRALENNIAVILIQQQHYDEAKKRLDSALKSDAQVATTLENLNKLYAYDAQKAYQKIFKKTSVTRPTAELLYFDVKTAQMPSANVITDLNDAGAITLVRNRTEQWRQAWTNQDIDHYLSFYDKQEFIPKNGMSFQSWEKSRHRSLKGPKYIKIFVDNPVVSLLSENMVRVNFYQRYESDRFKDDINKVLLWKKRNGQWNIVQEVVIYDAK